MSLPQDTYFKLGASTQIQSQSPGRFVDRYQHFAIIFTQVPQIIMSIYHLDYSGPGPNGYQIIQNQITTTGFNIKFVALQAAPVFGLQIHYLALVDDNIQVDFQIITTTISTTTLYTFNFQQTFSVVPNGAIFLYGINIVNVNPPYNSIMWIEIGALTLSTYQFSVLAMYGCILNTVSVAIIAGPNNYLSTGEYLMSSLGRFSVGIVNAQVKRYSVGFIGLQVDGGGNTCYSDYSSIDINQNGLIDFSKCLNGQSLISSKASYFYYKPCASYCDYCPVANSVLLCHTCISSTLRINPPKCTCPRQYYAVTSDPNCYLCNAICDDCSGNSINCTLCQASTQRLSPPSCSTCPPHMFIRSGVDDCQQCANYCDQCLISLTNCTVCSLSTFKINPPHCSECPIGMYSINGNLHCQQCSNECLICQDQSGHCIKCQSDNFYVQEQQCILCPTGCLTCNSQICLTCNLLRVMVDGICQCESPCLTCDDFSCLTCISPDYRIQNNMCKLCPEKCTACNEVGDCLIGPQNCSVGTINGDHVQCQQCKLNYYLNNNHCIQCSDECLGCQNQPHQCTSCRFNNLSSQNLSNLNCLMCESQIGFYSDQINNTCYTICGDGTSVGNEQCDDGNNNSNDGCTDCQLDSGYSCSGYICYMKIYPTPIIQEHNQDIYQPQKNITLTYNVPIATVSIDIKLDIIPIINFNYNITKINDNVFQILLDLQGQSVKPQLSLTFIAPDKIMSYNDKYFTYNSNRQQLFL